MNIATLLAVELHRFITPLYDVAYGRDTLGELRKLLRNCGWTVVVDPTVTAVIDVIDPLVAAIETFLEDPIPDDLEEAIARIEQITDLVDDLRGIGASLAGIDGGPAPTPAAIAALGEDLLHYLALRWLESKAQVIATTDLLQFTTFVEVDEIQISWLKRRAGLRRQVQLATITDLLRDPGGFVLDKLAPDGWGTQTHVEATMLQVSKVLTPILSPGGWRPAMRSRRFLPDPRDVAAQITKPNFTVAMPSGPNFPGVTLALDVDAAAADATLPSGSQGPGIALVPGGTVSYGGSLLGWSVGMEAEIDTDGQTIEITPDGVSFEPDIATSLEASASRPLDIVLGLERTGLKLGEINITTSATVSAGDTPEITAEIVARDSQIGVNTADFGSAIATILPLDLQVPFELGLAWSSLTGLSLSGSATLEVTVANQISFANGAFVFRDIILGFNMADGDDAPETITASVQGGVDFTLTEFAATVDGVGLNTEISFPDGGGNLGQAHLGFGLKLPDSLGLTVDLEAVKGGGFIDINHEIGRYSGALSIKIIEVGIAAITVIDTQLPGTDDGWAFFAALSLEFPAIPLGFGFTLSGIGGLVAINRGIDTIAIAGGLKSGVVDSLLFPDDPVNDAPMLISMIDDYFPILPGNTVFGPIVELGWGAPKTLITAQLGIVISLPEGKIALLGSIFAILPTPDTPLLSLRMDLIGEINIPDGTMFMMASLYDSRLLETIELSGDMGMFLATKGQPYFLMSVGGYHPGFEPPALVPAPLHDLRRMTASVSIASSVSLTITSYFAVTSNTVQFGAGVVLEMSTKVLVKTYVARGEFSFDVLLRFDPFAIIAEIAASVGVYSGDKELMGVHLSARIEGPEPWYATGRAEFKFFGIKVKFNVEVGNEVGDGTKPRVSLLEDVVAALAARQSWQEVAPLTGTPSELVFIDLNSAGDNSDSRIWVRPDRSVQVMQGIAPLNRQIDVVGQGLPVAGDEYLEITSAGLVGLDSAYDEIDDWFAPAQFEQLGRREKLSRASFEEMCAGVTFGAVQPETTAYPTTLATTSTLAHEESWCERAKPRILVYDDVAKHAIGEGMAAQALNARTARPTPQFSVEPIPFAVVDDTAGTPVATVLDTGSSNAQGAALQAAAGLGNVRVVSAASQLEGA